MRNLIALVLCLFLVMTFAEEYEEHIILSTPEEIVTLNSDKSTLIGGLVNPLSGQLALHQIDLIVKGAQDIVLNRLYIPPTIPSSFPPKKKHQEEWNKYYLNKVLINQYRGWVFLPHLKLECFTDLKKVRVSNETGVTLEYHLSGKNFLKAELVSPSYALSNMSGDRPSGKYDPRNTRMVLDQKENTVKLFAPNGTIRVYGDGRDIALNKAQFFLLKEILPNGKILKYEYDRGRLSVIEAKDPKELFTYAKVLLNTTAAADLFTSPTNGLKTQYSKTWRSNPCRLKEHPETGQKCDKFEWNPILPNLLSEVNSPFFHSESISYDNNFLLTEYYGRSDIFTCQYEGYGIGNKPYKIKTLFFPIGPGDSFLPMYSFDYQPPNPGKNGGYTTVRNPDGSSIRYEISQNMLPMITRWYDQKNNLKKEKSQEWYPNNWLKAIEMKDGQGKILYRKSFRYDDFGNPIYETFSGDLTGTGNEETYTIKREYSNDGRNLLLCEETEENKITIWNYLPNTNLVTVKLILENDQIRRREFYVYDDCYNLIQEIYDDGSSHDKDDTADISQRTIKTYTLRQHEPFLHMPEVIKEEYWENGACHLLNSTHLVYDIYGNIKEEQVYGSDGQYAYTLRRTYNERGDLLSETNPLDYEATYKYDDRGRRYYETNFSNCVNTKIYYDQKGRLKKREEQSIENDLHITTFEYDLQDRLCQKVDCFDNIFHYEHDPITHKITTTKSPSVISYDENEQSVLTKTEYDALGRIISKKDANQNTTVYECNAYGSPTRIIHPNGGEEYFCYNRSGELKAYTDPDGLTIKYSRDIFGRVQLKTYFDSSGEQIAKETFAYNGFNLKTKTDKEGNIKEYFYDGAGRKVKEECSGRMIEFAYDPLGYLTQIIKHNDDNTLIITYTRDFLGQILEETRSDLSGNLLYKIAFTYDKNGNQKTIKRFIDGKEALESFEYDSYNRLKLHTDAYGHKTTKKYDEHHINPIGQKVLQVTTINPLSVTSIQTRDAYGKPVIDEKLDPYGRTIAYEQKTYDPVGNLTYRLDHVYQGSTCLETQIVNYDYTSQNQIKSETRGYSTDNPRTTSYTYTLSGKLKTKTFPNQALLTYEYHPLGFLEVLSSSDREIFHTFEYDNEGHLKIAIDQNQGFVIERALDPFGNITKETFSNGLMIEKEYDALDRPLSMKIPTVGKIIYEYDPQFLKTIKRFSTQEALLYAHSYDKYDLDGNLLSENLIHDLGTISHAFDLKGRHQNISSSYFAQSAEFDPCDNLKTSTINSYTVSYTYDHLSQLKSETSNNHSQIYEHDSIQGQRNKNNIFSDLNNLNELNSLGKIECDYDLNGNQKLKSISGDAQIFTYDPLNRLTSVIRENTKIDFSYDPLGRRLSKRIYTKGFWGWYESSEEHYLYDKKNEIGAFTKDGTPKNLKVPGAHDLKPIALELEGSIYAPIVDMHGNIRRLIDTYWKSIKERYDYTAFGEHLNNSSALNPWQYAGKRLDAETGLIYFGKRYYDPQLSRWLTTDPAGFIDSMNLYQYALNNPFYYYDTYGENLLGFLCGVGQILAGGVIMATGVALEIGTYGGYTFAIGFHEAVGLSLMTTGCAQAMHHARDLSFPKEIPGLSTNQWNTYKSETEEKKKEPPYSGKDLGDDPAKPPAEGFEWKGNGEPGSQKGSWVKGQGQDRETLHPDLDHLPPKDPHWDYVGPNFPRGARLNLDGTWESK